MVLRKALLLMAVALMWEGCGSHRVIAPQSAMNPMEIADRASPATVQIAVEFGAKGRVTRLEVDSVRLVNAMRVHVGEGNIKGDEVVDALLKLFESDPASYMSRGDVEDLDETMYSLGTGFIVTPDGYVLTNAHVVGPEQDELKKEAVESVNHLVELQVHTVEQALARVFPDAQWSDSAREKLRDVIKEQYALGADLRFSKRIVIVFPTVHGDKSAYQLPATVESIGTETPGKDIAILKVDGSDLPTVSLARSIAVAGVRPGAEVYVLGYPGSVSLASGFAATNKVQSSLTAGHVSALKDMSGGWQVLQMDAAINPGNSGGPVFDRNGDVVGLATFQLRDTQGVNFAESVDLAEQFLDAANVRPSMSQYTRTYDQALEEYNQQGHGRALSLFRQLAEEHPELSSPRQFLNVAKEEHPIVNAQVRTRELQEGRGLDKPNEARGHERHETRGNLTPLLVVGLVIVAILGLGVFLASRR